MQFRCLMLLWATGEKNKCSTNYLIENEIILQRKIKIFKFWKKIKLDIKSLNLGEIN